VTKRQENTAALEKGRMPPKQWADTFHASLIILLRDGGILRFFRKPALRVMVHLPRKDAS
jgi:hypothetical protein